MQPNQKSSSLNHLVSKRTSRDYFLLETVLAQIDLRSTHGLAQIRHRGPCIVELQSIHLPDDEQALHFLHSVGLPDEQISVYRASRT